MLPSELVLQCCKAGSESQVVKLEVPYLETIPPPGSSMPRVAHLIVEQLVPAMKQHGLLVVGRKVRLPASCPCRVRMG